MENLLKDCMFELKNFMPITVTAWLILCQPVRIALKVPGI
jgi:hypothetical protein